MVTDSRGFTCGRRNIGTGESFGCCPSGKRGLLALAAPLASSGEGAVDQEGVAVNASATTEMLAAAKILVGRYSCATCDASTQCCLRYELCVSCCMGPDRAGDRAALAKRSVHSAMRALAQDPFKMCAYKCRTSSGSVVHENSYRSPLKFCFGLKRSPLAPGVSVNSDLSAAKEDASGRSSVAESEREGLDPYVLPDAEPPLPSNAVLRESRGLVGLGVGAEGLTRTIPQILPCRIDECGAAVPKRYP